MVAEPKEIPIEPDSELARLLEEAARGDVVLVEAGRRFRVVEERTSPFASYDPERVQAALEQSFGSLKGLDVSTFLDELRDQRRQDRYDLPTSR